MREYETTFIVQPEISDEGSQSILGRLDGILETGGATRLMCEDHGKRKLAYEIRKFHKGHYYTLQFLDGGAAIPELERTLRLDESVLRFLTIMANPEVMDVEARKAEAAEAEAEQQKRAVERAAREAEEAAARREQEEAERVAAEEAAARSEAAAEATEAATAEAEAVGEAAVVEPASEKSGEQEAAVVGDAAGEDGAAAEQEDES